MGRAKKSKVKPTLDAYFFSTPDQKLLKFLLSEPTTSFTPRVLSSKLKSVRGLGGAEGIQRILETLSELGMVQFIDNNRAVIAQNDHIFVQKLKIFSAICDLEGLKELVEPLSTKAVLFGSRATGKYGTGSNYNLFVVSSNPEEVKKIVGRHPLGKRIEVMVMTPSENLQVESKDPQLFDHIQQGIVLWGVRW